MKYLLFLLLLLPMSGLLGKTGSLPSELLMRPWWNGGEVSLLGIFEPEAKSRTGLILQIPFSFSSGEEFRLLLLRTSRDRERRFFQTFGFGYRSPHFRIVGFQIQLGGSPEIRDGFSISLGIYRAQGSLECFGRKSLEEKSHGFLLRAGSVSEPNLFLGWERIQTVSAPSEDRLSFGGVWSWSSFLSEAGLQEEKKEPNGYLTLGFSPFAKTKEPEIVPAPPPPKKEKSIPALSPEELLQIGFSVSESLSISAASRRDPEEFQNLLLGLSEEKRKKVRRLLQRKAGSLR